MRDLLQSLGRLVQVAPERSALCWRGGQMTYRELSERVKMMAQQLASYTRRPLGLLVTNRPAWVVADLAAMQAGCTLVPVPAFFSPGQQAHIRRAAKLDAIICQPELIEQGMTLRRIPLSDDLQLIKLAADSGPAATSDKITFTSGTTGAPKGVCLAADAMARVVESLITVTGTTKAERHACLMPLSTLLENLGGVCRTLQAGGQVWLDEEVATCLPTEQGGARLAAFLRDSAATSAILTPGHLRELVMHLQASGDALPALRLLAVGGAPTPPPLLEAALRLGLPLSEGYGLSEACSVVTLQSAEFRRPGSVGRPLPHVEVKLAADGEILVRGALFTGYLGEDSAQPADTFWPTGDIGELDADGYLYVHGRKRPFQITGYGRNIDPGWLAAVLEAEPEIDQARVIVEGLPAPLAQLASRTSAAELESAVQRANRQLPPYAQIERWSRLDRSILQQSLRTQHPNKESHYGLS